jgi:thiamine-monophosphate kinase
VSGCLGDAALALAALKRRLVLNARERAQVQQRLHAPTPRLALGVALRKIAHSAIDVSDGLCADLGHICERSRVAAVIEFECLPVSPVMRRHLDRPAAQAALLAGGDDYELCFTAHPAQHEGVLKAARRTDVKVTAIGRVTAATHRRPAVTVLRRDGRTMKVKSGGYDHFR